jgi:hypothetical protein
MKLFQQAETGATNSKTLAQAPIKRGRRELKMRLARISDYRLRTSCTLALNAPYNDFDAH